MSMVKDQELNESIERQAIKAAREVARELLNEPDKHSEKDQRCKEAIDNRLAKRLAEETPSEPVKIETEGVFDPSLLDQPDPKFLEEMGAFLDNPMTPIIKMLTQSLESLRPKPFEFPALPLAEHRVKIFRLNDQADLAQIESAIEEYLNNGWCCHHPTICGDFVLMDFSRRKESEEDGRNDRAKCD